MKVEPILKQNQTNRDFELSKILNVPLPVVENLTIGESKTIRIWQGVVTPKNECEMTALYRDLKFLDRVGYFKTLMWTSIYRRGKLIRFLLSQKGKTCLDYGCGVASHSIILAERGNNVTMVDVDGPMLDFASKRVSLRKVPCVSMSDNTPLAENHYDTAICVEVLEHVYNPLSLLEKIDAALKTGSKFFLRYSTMIKDSSGHFAGNIAKIKKECLPFLNDKYTMVEKDVYEKR